MFEVFNILGHFLVWFLVRNTLPLGVNMPVAAADPEEQPPTGNLVYINCAHTSNKRAAAIGVQHVGTNTDPFGCQGECGQRHEGAAPGFGDIQRIKTGRFGFFGHDHHVALRHPASGENQSALHTPLLISCPY